MMHPTLRPLVLAATLLVSAYSSCTQAQQLEEVVVTAQKRAQSLQNVAISVAVVSGEELARDNKTRISELARIVPNLTYGSSTSDAGQSVILRGVGTQTFSRGVEQSVGTVIDGVAAGSVSGSLLDFSDVERVEVLRGPQGMLFGKNASAGVLSITTKMPTETFGAGLGASYGEKNALQLNGYLSGPLLDDRLLARVAAYSNTRDGIIENEFPGGEDFNDRDEWGVRSKLRWFITDSLEALLAYNHVERDHICCLGSIELVEPGSVVDRFGGERGPKTDTLLDNDLSTGSTELDLYSLDLNFTWGEHTLTSTTAYIEEDVFAAARGDTYTRTALPVNDSFESYQQFTQELRITSPASNTLSYVAGMYYFDKKIDRTFTRVIDLYGIDFAPQPDSGAISVVNESRNNNESMALYGQLTWNLSEHTRLLAGARYNDDELTTDQVVSALPGTIPEAPPGTVNDKTDEQALSWRIIGEMDFAAEAMLYTSIAQGYKGPGANTLPSGPSSGEDVFVDPEVPTNYELGVKSQWLDNRLRVNGAIYYTEFKDFQASAQVPNAFPPLLFLTNAGELETQGVEVEITAQITDGLSAWGSFAYTNATFSDWDDAPCYEGQTAAEGCIDEVQDLSGADMPDSPEWAYTIGANYIVPLNAQPFDGYLRGNYHWQDEVQYDTTNNPLHIGDAYGTLDLYMGLEAKNGRYSAQVFVLNALDEYYINGLTGQSVIGLLAAHGLSYDYKRRWGVSVRFNY